MERGNQGLDGNEQMATSGPKSKSPPFFFSQNYFQGIYDVGSNIKFISCFFVKYCLEDFFCKGGGGRSPPNRPKVVRQQKFPRNLAEEQEIGTNKNK